MDKAMGNAQITSGEPVEDHLAALADYARQVARSGVTNQLAYDATLGAILSGILRSGDRLAEIPVGRALGVGRTPVREALMRLQAEGFVASEPRVGLVVAGNTLESLAELYEVREVLEGLAARLAARYARPADTLAICQILDESVAATERHDTAALRVLNTRFHEAIHSAAHNQQLKHTLRSVINRLRLSPASAYRAVGRAEEAFGEHRQLLDAILAHDEEHAERLAIEHQRRDKEARLAQMAAIGHIAPGAGTEPRGTPPD